MRTIVHISDLHFGRNEKESITALALALGKSKPDLVVISGDLTQRALVSEYKEAKLFLEKLRQQGLSYFVIPGNHDILPLYRPVSRVRSPYRRYQQYISDDIEPRFTDGELAIAALNTVRTLHVKSGKVIEEKVRHISEWFESLGDDLLKIIVSHHPLDLPPHRGKRKLAKHSESAIEMFAKNNVLLYLSGHYHVSSQTPVAERYAKPEYPAVAVQAGTVSLRQRGERQSFNVIDLEKTSVEISTHLFDPEKNDFHFDTKKKFLFQ